MYEKLFPYHLSGPQTGRALLFSISLVVKKKICDIGSRKKNKFQHVPEKLCQAEI